LRGFAGRALSDSEAAVTVGCGLSFTKSFIGCCLPSLFEPFDEAHVECFGLLPPAVTDNILFVAASRGG
jgi:hypothetical protein